MTKAEQRKMRQLEIENKLLREKVDAHFRVYRENLYELVELKTKYDMIREIVGGEE